MATFEIVHEILRGYSSPGKDRSTAEDLRIALYDTLGHDFFNLPVDTGYFGR